MHPSRILSIKERDKLFKWQRHTTLHPSPGDLELQCFPSLDYVEHWATIVATYLALNRKSPEIDKFGLPTRTEQMKPRVESNLKTPDDVDVDILGCVQGVGRFTSGA
jgi:hypothetical protein